MAGDWDRHEADLIACRKCSRLVQWREKIAREKRRAFSSWDYWGKPVPGFGDRNGRVVVIGLAPGAHGSNRTGRMFTGDSSGDFLYAALHRAGFANQPLSTFPADGLTLKDIFITAVCRCAPPENKPQPGEMINCRPFMLAEFDMLPARQGFVALGRIAFDNLLSIYREWGFQEPAPLFAHGTLHTFENHLPWIITSYHPSRQNTQTRRLTQVMFDEVWELVKQQVK